MSELIDREGERLTAVEARAKSNSRRIDKLEQSTDALARLATLVEVMSTKQDQIAEAVVKLDNKVDTLENKPARRWDGLVDKVILAVATALVTFLLARLGMAG